MITNYASYIKRNLNKKLHYEDIDIHNFDSDKFLLFCASGNGTVKKKSSNGFCKIPEHLLKLLFDGNEMGDIYKNVDLIGVVYPQNDPKYIRGQLTSTDICDIVDNILLPRCVDNDGEKLPMDTIRKKMSRIGFFTFCQGAKEVARIMYCLSNRLSEDYLFSQEEIDSILTTMRQISFSPYVDNDVIPSIRIDSFLDWRNENLLKDKGKSLLGKELDGVAVVYEEAGTMKGQVCDYAHFGCVHIYSSKLRNIEDKDLDEHNIVLLDRDEDWNASITWIEELNYKYYPGKNADCVSQMVAWSLSRMVENGLENRYSDKYIPQMSLTELMSELHSIQSSFSEEELMGKN